MTTLLVLGGSALARRTADALEGCFAEKGIAVRIVYALAGATSSPRRPRGEVEVLSGGFGGAKGLQKWLHDNEVAAIIDATHPFAEQISENARQAARALALPLFRLRLPAFPRLYTKKRFLVSSVSFAETLPRLVASLPSSYRRSVLCALGARRIDSLAKRLPARRLLLRSFASAQRQGELRLRTLRLRRARCLDFCAMGPCSAQSVRQEMRWMKRRRVSLLLRRDSGAREAFAKIVAAQRLSLPVVVLARPPSPSVPTLSLRDLSPILRLVQRQLPSRSESRP